MAFADTLHRASWRGVPFAMETAQASYGRRKLRHDYPYRDTVWLEDQGKLPRQFRMMGFLVGNSLIYGGGDLQGQIKRLEAAAETSGAGILVHPTRGRLTVDLLDLAIIERWDDGNVAEVAFTFIQGGTQIFPAIAGALGDLVGKAAGLADAAGLSAFSSAVLGPLQSGLSSVTALSATANEWADKLTGLARDATGLYGTVSQLGGADFGRFFNGRNAGFLTGLVSPYAGAASIGDLIALGASKRADISTATAAVTAAIGRLGAGGSSGDVATAVQASVAALQGAAADPSDGVRLLGGLSAFSPISPSSKQTAGLAMSDLFQRAAAAAIARTGATYAPSSADDAHAVRGLVLGPVETAIARAGQTGEDSVFQAFRGLRASVVQDLADRGAGLARLVTLQAPQSLPSVLLAQQQYADSSRADELVIQAVPIHPWFMPTAFRALAG